MAIGTPGHGCAARRGRAQEGWLHLDAHILATPAIGDLAGDGRDALVVGVSWFFDREYYEDAVRPSVNRPDTLQG